MSRLLLAQQNENTGDYCENGNHDMETCYTENSQPQDADQDQVNSQQEQSDVFGDIHPLCFGFSQVGARPMIPF